MRLFINQDALEPILRARAAELGARLRYRTECTSLEQDADGVTAVVRDLSDGSESLVRAQYVVAADGNRSPARERLGIGMHGHGLLSHSITIYFRALADLGPLLKDRNQGVHYVTNPLMRGFFEHFGKPFVPPQGIQPATATSAGQGTGTVSPSSPLMAQPRGSLAQVTAYLLARPHGAYSKADVEAIAGDYFAIAGPLGLDPLVAASQMIEETAHLSSFWSQPPRHNMAGIGVTGEDGVGVSFPSAHVGVRAQLGRLLAYALKAGTETPGQLSLIEEALSFRPLPSDHRGVAPTLAGLAGPGRWAADPQYANKIAWIADQVIGAA